MGVNSLPKTVTRQRRDCDLNPGPSAPESSTLTTRLPSHPKSIVQLFFRGRGHAVDRYEARNFRDSAGEAASPAAHTCCRTATVLADVSHVGVVAVVCRRRTHEHVPEAGGDVDDVGEGRERDEHVHHQHAACVPHTHRHTHRHTVYATRHVLRIRKLRQPVRRATVGSRAFPVAAAHTWNSLPEHIVSASTLQSFKRHLKTFVLQQSFRLHSSGPRSDLDYLGHYKKP